MRTNVPIFKLKEATVRRRYSDFKVIFRRMLHHRVILIILIFNKQKYFSGFVTSSPAPCRSWCRHSPAKPLSSSYPSLHRTTASSNPSLSRIGGSDWRSSAGVLWSRFILWKLLLGIYQQDRWSPAGAGRALSPYVPRWAQPRQDKLCSRKSCLIEDLCSFWFI